MIKLDDIYSVSNGLLYTKEGFMEKNQTQSLREKYKEFQDSRRKIKHVIEYDLVEQDVFRINMKSMKNNEVVRSQINASSKVEVWRRSHTMYQFK